MGQPSEALREGRGQPPLAEIARELLAGSATPQELHAAFLAATVFCEAGEQPGFTAVGPPGAGLVPVFSSEQELLRARGLVRWFATTGVDLIGLLPDGYEVLLDMAGEAPLRLRPSALRPVIVPEVNWE